MSNKHAHITAAGKTVNDTGMGAGPFKTFFRAFFHAFCGLKFFFVHERNALFHLTAAFAVICSGFIFHISETEWLAVFISIGLVVGFEIMNSAIEQLCNFTEPAYHSSIKKIKDLAAASVFVTAVISIVVAGIIFLPKILHL